MNPLVVVAVSAFVTVFAQHGGAITPHEQMQLQDLLMRYRKMYSRNAGLPSATARGQHGHNARAWREMLPPAVVVSDRDAMDREASLLMELNSQRYENQGEQMVEDEEHPWIASPAHRTNLLRQKLRNLIESEPLDGIIDNNIVTKRENSRFVHPSVFKSVADNLDEDLEKVKQTLEDEGTLEKGSQPITGSEQELMAILKQLHHSTSDDQANSLVEEDDTGVNFNLLDLQQQLIKRFLTQQSSGHQGKGGISGERSKTLIDALKKLFKVENTIVEDEINGESRDVANGDVTDEPVQEIDVSTDEVVQDSD